MDAKKTTPDSLYRDDMVRKEHETVTVSKTLYQVRRYTEDGSEQIGGRLYSKRNSERIVNSLIEIKIDAYKVPMKIKTTRTKEKLK